MKLFVFIILGLLLVGVVVLINMFSNSEEERERTPSENLELMQQVYQGPVRPTDDEDYFRETGITRPLEVKEWV